MVHALYFQPLGRLRQEDYRFWASLGNLARPRFKIKLQRAEDEHLLSMYNILPSFPSTGQKEKKLRHSSPQHIFEYGKLRYRSGKWLSMSPRWQIMALQSVAILGTLVRLGLCSPVVISVWGWLHFFQHLRCSFPVAFFSMSVHSKIHPTNVHWRNQIWGLLWGGTIMRGREFQHPREGVKIVTLNPQRKKLGRRWERSRAIHGGRVAMPNSTSMV